MAPRLSLAVGSTNQQIEIVPAPHGAFKMVVGGREHAVRLERVGDGNLYRLLVDGRAIEVVIARERGGLKVVVGPDTHMVTVQRGGVPGAAEGLATAGREFAITAPMAGAIVELLVAEGDRVVQGDLLIVIVAMKMNNEIRSPLSGSVKSVHVEPDDAVEPGALLLVLAVQEERS